MPTVVEEVKGNGAHESVLRAYHILEKVKAMLGRGDSQETILDVIAECESESLAETQTSYLHPMEKAAIKARIDKVFI